MRTKLLYSFILITIFNLCFFAQRTQAQGSRFASLVDDAKYAAWIGTGLTELHYIGDLPMNYTGGVEAYSGKWAGDLKISVLYGKWISRTYNSYGADYYYPESELDVNIDLLAKYNVRKLKSRNRFNVIAGLGYAHARVKYPYYIFSDYSTTLQADFTTAKRNIFSIPLGFSYDVRIGEHFGIGNMTLWNRSLYLKRIEMTQNEHYQGYGYGTLVRGVPVYISILFYLKYYF